ncbi:MAG: glycosyltransferase [Lachnospiraceae bacterium]|nr:glycosyltransferase [Lachnospiraceae bacterium]
MNIVTDDIAVSVICLAYNHEKYIRQTLEGFVNQVTDFRYEVLVHDDASTDGTKAIIEEYVHEYPDIFVPIYQEENQYSKGNLLIPKTLYKLIRGKYVASCEGDDYWCDNNKLQMQYDVMESNPECSICIHKVKCINEDGSDNLKTFPNENSSIGEGLIPKARMAEKLWKKDSYPFHTSSYFVRRSVYDKKRELFESESWVYKINGDASTMWMSLYLGDFYYIDKVMSRRRLEVPGSYNERLKKSSAELKFKKWKDRIEGIWLYDEYSQKEFHPLIQYYIIDSVAKRIKVDLDDPFVILRQCGITFKDVVGKVKVRISALLAFVYLFPSSIRFIRRLWVKWDAAKGKL